MELMISRAGRFFTAMVMRRDNGSSTTNFRFALAAMAVKISGASTPTANTLNDWALPETSRVPRAGSPARAAGAAFAGEAGTVPVAGTTFDAALASALETGAGEVLIVPRCSAVGAGGVAPGTTPGTAGTTGDVFVDEELAGAASFVDEPFAGVWPVDVGAPVVAGVAGVVGEVGEAGAGCARAGKLPVDTQNKSAAKPRWNERGNIKNGNGKKRRYKASSVPR